MKLLSCAVWRHVLGKDDVVDQLSLSLGKCKSIFFIYLIYYFSFFVGIQAI